ncbi:MAG: DNA gyrase inhibitor YacG [Candidatus Thiodiazotropha sp. (ex Ctena orbiculata)]|nr:DNA gyrase inhibitor YacG [Candidatus Thiodiazotropha taylori]
MEKTAPPTVPCPNCGKSVLWQESSKWKPFCSERCRLIDLGDWLDENHRISVPLNGQFEEEPFD